MDEMISNIPNSLNNNKDNLEVITIAKLKERENPKKLLTAKIVCRITNVEDIPQYPSIKLAPIWQSTAKVTSSV